MVLLLGAACESLYLEEFGWAVSSPKEEVRCRGMREVDSFEDEIYCRLFDYKPD